MNNPTYEDRIRDQIAQYAETKDMHDLPAAFHIFSHICMGPPIAEVFGEPSIPAIYARAYIEATQTGGNSGRILSIGCGDGSIEIQVARVLLERGVRDFTFHCADLSPILLGNLTRAVEAEGLSSYFVAIETDLNDIKIPGDFDVVMANHSLHHIAHLEQLVKYAYDHLTDSGIFATCDVIGRNGHMRWPEAAAILQSIWPTLEPQQRYHSLLRRHSDTFVDHDCSTEGFEGIRAQDILPLLLTAFHPYKFVAAGGFADLLVDRGYGHGFDVNVAEHVAFVRFVAELNDILLDAGVVTPTLMMAYFTKNKCGEVFYRDRRAIHALREPSRNPSWTRFYTTPAQT